MRRFSDISDGQFMSETTDGSYCLFSEAQAEIERLRNIIKTMREEGQVIISGQICGSRRAILLPYATFKTAAKAALTGEAEARQADEGGGRKA